MLPKNVRYILALGFIAAGPCFAAMHITSAGNTKNALPYVPGRILVKTYDESSPSALGETAKALGASLLRSFTIVPGLALFEYDDSIDVHDAISTFAQNPDVEYAEPDFYYRAAIQNDPAFPEQWGLENQGQTGGSVDADINALSMWAIEDGSPAVVVGIIDTGIDYNHLDLAANVWRNPSEVPGNGLDDDQNGYVDDVYGINAVLNNGNPLDDNAHGTHVAGTIGADGNNQRGVVGVAQDIQMAACKFLDSTGSGSTSDAIQCLQYFASLKTRAVNPVNIVATNNSWGGGGQSTALRDAIRVHESLGILFVAAAGNESQNNDITGSFPANYDVPNIISVAATDHNDRLSSFSNYGKRTVHVGAPGSRILSTVLNQGYAAFSGTSMATPHVTGLVGVLKSRYPSYDYKKIKNLIFAGATPLSSLQAATITGRRIRGADTNGRGSLTCANQNINARLKPISNSVSIPLGSSIFLSALKINCDLPAGPVIVYSDALETVTLQDNGLNGDLAANDGNYSLSWRPQRAQSYILNYGGGDTITVTVTGTNPSRRYSAQSVSFAYETITGTSLAASDESVHNLSLPFPIHFNDSAAGFQNIYVGANGTISFTSATNPGYNNKPLPTSTPSTLVAPYWDDLIPSGTNSNIYAASLGSAPNRRVIIEWRNLRHYNISGRVTFQVVFYENSSEIRFNYFDTLLDNTAYNYGASATIGVQTSTTTASQYSYNSPAIASQTSLVWRLQ